MKIEDLNVLLVEDDRNVRATVRSMLQEMGINSIHESHDGQAAWEYLENNDWKINMIICDWNMPHVTGIEFLREVRLAYPNMAFLMITARADKNSVLAAKSCDVTGYIRKPFSFEDLRKKIASMI